MPAVVITSNSSLLIALLFHYNQ